MNSQASSGSPFQLQAECPNSQARAGALRTAHGEIHTPIFMPVGTQGSVKAMSPRLLKEVGAEIILGNSYHLYLRPGLETLREAGGLHRFMNWDRPILTDSGGYQVFSLRDLRTINPDGVEFRSHIDGSKHSFTSESVIAIQRYIGSDIMMCFDECTPYPCSREDAKRSMDMTLRWEERCLIAHRNQDYLYGFPQLLFAIGQGSIYQELRQECMKRLTEFDFDGFAIGGLAIGEPLEQLYDIVECSTAVMPRDKARYLMGVGTPQNILEAIDRGVDMFDCVMPTRNARNGTLFTTKGKINIKNASLKGNNDCIDPGLDNEASSQFSLGYLRHLFVANEILGLQLASMQNLAFYLWLVRTAREKILEGTFRSWKESFLAEFYPTPVKTL